MTAQPRVLHVAQPVDGGVARCVEQYLVGAREQGWPVALACPGAPLAEKARAAGAVMFGWPAGRGLSRRTLTESAGLRRVVREWRPQVVHLHSSTAAMAGRLAVRGRLPTIVQPHAWSFEAVTGPMARGVMLWEQWAARWTSLLLCVSEAERARGATLGIGGPMAVAVNGVDLDTFGAADDVDRRAARRALGFDDRPLVVCLGRLSRQKGQDVLLNSWSNVTTAVPEARLALVGDGPDRQSLESRATPGVIFAGATDRPDLWFAAADVVALPSRWEGHPFALLEAMATARSVVASDVDGVGETLGNGGALFSQGDVDELADALITRLRNPSLAQAEGKAGRVLVENHHDVRATVSRVLELTESLVADRGV